MLMAAEGGPPVIMYAATNLTNDPLDQFTVMAFTFKADGTLKARQVAPGRRALDGAQTSTPRWCSTAPPVEAGDSIVIGVNQAQRVGSDAWWRADVQAA